MKKEVIILALMCYPAFADEIPGYRFNGTENPPSRICLYYSGYTDATGTNHGAMFAANSNAVWHAAADAAVSGLNRYSEQVIQIDDGWSTWRDANGKLMPGTTNFIAGTGDLYGSNPEYGMTNLIRLVHAMSPNLLVGMYFYFDPQGVTSDGWEGTDPAHIRQDATNAALWGVDFVKLDSISEDWGFTQRLAYIKEFAYWYRKTAIALGHRNIVKVDFVGPEWGDEFWSDSDASELANVVDVWNPCLELTYNYGSKENYERFQQHFDNYYVPYHKLTVRQGHWLEMEGVIFGQCASDCGITSINQINAGRSIAAMLVTFNSPLHYGSVNSPDYAFYQKNALLLSLDKNFSQKPVLVYRDTNSPPRFEIWRRDLGGQKYLLWFWNRQYSLPASFSFSDAVVGIPGGLHHNTEVFFGTNYYSSSQWTMNLQPAQSHLVICSPYP